MEPFEAVRSLVTGGGFLDEALRNNELLSLELGDVEQKNAETFVEDIVNELRDRYIGRLTM